MDNIHSAHCETKAADSQEPLLRVALHVAIIALLGLVWGGWLNQSRSRSLVPGARWSYKENRCNPPIEDEAGRWAQSPESATGGKSQ